MSTLHTRIRQWTLTNGVRQVHSDLLVVRTSATQRSSRRDDHVFVAVQAVDNVVGEDAACALVADTLVSAFQADRSLSLTSALLHAFAAAHEALCAHNAHVPAAERTLVGASCAVLHNTSLYVAYVDPAHVWVRHNGHLRAIPAVSGAAADPSQALGSPLYTAPEFAHTLVAAGDVLVLCSPNVAQAVRPAQAETVLRSGDANTVADQLYDLCAAAPLHAAHVLVIDWVATTPQRVGTPDQDAHAHTPPHVLAHDQAVPAHPLAVHREQRNHSTRRAHATPRDAQPAGKPHPPATTIRMT